MLTATFEEPPSVPTQLRVGDYFVSVTNAGFYAFLFIVNKCLMNGFDGNGQADIPDGTILSLKKGAKSINDRWLVPIGATSFEGKTNEEVYSR